MRSRLRIGLLFTFNPVWMGGLIYLQNIVRAMNFLDDECKPEITVFHKPELAEFVGNLDYPGLELRPFDYPEVKRGITRSLLTRSNHFLEPIWQGGNLDVLFPVQDMPIRSSARAVAWYADLQHRYYPEFFSRANRLQRELRIRLLLRNCRQLVVSSQAVADDFKKFYRIPDHLRLDIYRFVSPVTPRGAEEVHEVQNRYGIHQPFFIVSNQFHKHKNHRVVLQAFGTALSKLGDARLVLTGRPPSQGDSSYMRELHDIMRTFGIEDRVLFLGAIPRPEQVALLQSAIAVVQPSLFEGWSTVIEDAKSLQVPVLASDLEVHREQLGSAARYFQPHIAEELAAHLAESYTTAGREGTPLYDSLEYRAKAVARGLLDSLSWQSNSDVG